MKAQRAIEIEVDWDGTEGSYNQQEYIHEDETFDAVLDISVLAERSIDKGDYWTPPYEEIIKEEFEVKIIEIDDKDCCEMKLSKEQRDEIVKSIKEQIKILN